MRHTYPVPTTHTIILHQRVDRMASCRPPPPRAAATPAAAAATAAAGAAATPGAAAIHAAATPLSSKDNASTINDILAPAFHATAAAVTIPGWTSTHMKVNVAATFCQKMPPVLVYFTKSHRRFRPRDEPGQQHHAACVAETARMVVCTPTTVPRL